jgi:hypothetical protein
MSKNDDKVKQYVDSLTEALGKLKNEFQTAENLFPAAFEEDTNDEFGEQDAVSTETKTVDQRRIGMLAQAYVGPDGQKLFVGDNHDGFPIFVAAHPITGFPWVDSRDRNVVVDPTTGQSFVQYEFKSAVVPENHPRFTDNDINSVAAGQVSHLDDGFVAFTDWLIANPPLSPEEVKRRAIRPWDGVNGRAKKIVGFFIKAATAFFMAFYHTLLKVEKLVDRVRFRKQNKLGAALVVKEENFGRFLNPISRSLMATPIKSDLLVDNGTGEVYQSRVLAMVTPMTPAGDIKPEYAERFCKLLNRLASEGVWKKGVLAPLSSVHIANGGANAEVEGQPPLFRYSKSLFVMLHVKQGITNEVLNAKYCAGLPVFSSGLGMNANWKQFPY